MKESNWLMPKERTNNDDQFYFAMHVDRGNVDDMKEAIAGGLVPKVDSVLICALCTSKYSHVKEVIDVIFLALDPENFGEYYKNIAAPHLHAAFFNPSNLSSDSLNLYKWLNQYSSIEKSDNIILIERICRWSRFGKGLDLLRYLIQQNIFTPDEIEQAVLASINNYQLEQVKIYIDEGIGFDFIPAGVISRLQDIRNSEFIRNFNLGDDSDDQGVLNRYQKDAHAIHNVVSTYIKK